MRHLMYATMEDLDELVTIDQQVIGSTSRRDFIQKAIAEGRCIIQKTQCAIVGFLIFSTDFFDCSFINLVIVKPTERRKGIATSLLAYYVERASTQKVFSSTNQSNTTMQKVFATAGFIRSGYVENLDEDDPEIIYFKLR
ncbi:GNAT superfamily N-acetyltransferase [Lysinibacillus parviboronicapiens]|uniref:GNAT superfamily N-acetyltransferase n=1 Tax=Lysinibacillus parviboronicapiens TaxID=436516 RepID=A0ABV2PQN3_9BACI